MKTGHVLAFGRAPIVLSSIVFLASIGCRWPERSPGIHGPALQDIVFSAKDLPKGFTVPKWEGEDKLPFVTSNPQISRQREFIEPLALEICGGELAKAVDRALFVIYADEAQEQQVLVVAFQFSNATLAGDAESAYQRAAKAGELDPSMIIRKGRVLAVMLKGLQTTEAAWSDMQKLLAAAMK